MKLDFGVSMKLDLNGFHRLNTPKERWKERKNLFSRKCQYERKMHLTLMPDWHSHVVCHVTEQSRAQSTRITLQNN